MKPQLASPGSSSPPALRLSLACDLAQVRLAARAVRRFLADQGCRGRELDDSELALVEACNNAVQNARRPALQPVEIEARCDSGEIQLRILDHTPGFAWPERAALPASESEGGRGLFLIQRLMDSAFYSPDPAGNTLLLRKRRRTLPVG